MSLAYNIFPQEDCVLVKVVNGFDLDFSKAIMTFAVSYDVSENKIQLESAIFQFAVNEMKMHKNGIKIWHCKEMTLEK